MERKERCISNNKIIKSQNHIHILKHPEPHFYEGQKPDIHTNVNDNIANTHHIF